MSLSSWTFQSHKYDYLTFFFLNHGHLVKGKEHQSNGIQPRSYIKLSPVRGSGKGDEKKEPWCKGDITFKFPRRQIPTDNKSPGENIYIPSAPHSPRFALRPLHKWKPRQKRKDMSNCFGGGMEWKIVWFSAQLQKKVVLNKMASR